MAGDAVEPVVHAWLDNQVAAGLVRCDNGRYALTDEGRFSCVEQAGGELAL